MYNFDKEMFPSLISSDILVGGYNSIGMADLSSKEQAALQQFFDALGQPIEEFDADNVLLVKADSEGIPVAIYGASIFRTDEAEPQMILKCGNNLWPVTQNKDSIACGGLTGEISFAEKSIEVSVKDDKGEEMKVPFWPATINLLYVPDGDEDNAIEYQVRCGWDPKTEPKPPTIKAKLKNGKSIANYFRTAPNGSGGGEAIKMQDLGVGRYPLQEVRSIEVNTENYSGTRYILKLDDDRQVWSRGNADIFFKSRAESNEPLLTPGCNATLIISECKQRGDGKWRVTCAIRESKPEGTIAPLVEPIPVAPVAAVEPATAPAVDYDTIPF